MSVIPHLLSLISEMFVISTYCFEMRDPQWYVLCPVTDSRFPKDDKSRVKER